MNSLREPGRACLAGKYGLGDWGGVESEGVCRGGDGAVGVGEGGV